MHRALTGDPNAAELAQISTGVLFLVRPDKLKGRRECMCVAIAMPIVLDWCVVTNADSWCHLCARCLFRLCRYPNAMITVRRTSKPFQFQLVVARVFEEGEELLDEDEEDVMDERDFLIAEEIQFRTGMHEGEQTFVWRDLDGDAGDLYEFVAEGTNAPTAAFFEASVLKAIYEFKYRTSSNGVSEDQLRAVAYKPEEKKTRTSPRNTRSKKAGETSKASPIQAEPSAPPTPQKVSPTKSPQKSPSKRGAPPQEEVSEVADDTKVIETQPAELYILDVEQDVFIMEAKVDAQIVESQMNDFEFWITATAEDGYTVLAHIITPDINGRWAKGSLSFVWNYPGEDNRINSWCFRFDDIAAFQRFQRTVSQCLYETTNQVGWGKAKADEREYALSSYQDVEMADPDDEEEIEDSLLEEEEEEPVDAKNEGGSEDDSDEEEAKAQNAKDGEINSHLTVGYKGDSTFVLRGNRIGIFRHTNDGKVKYKGTINQVTNGKGKQFKPKKLMLHDQDASMILMNPTDPQSLYRMDVEVGKVVEEWKIHEDVPILHMAPDTKFAQTTSQQTFVGASHNGLFRVDPRLPGTKLVDSQFKQYATKAAFSNVATTEAGKIAVASEKGDIRLFDSIGKNAKTALPALGDAVIGVDVTADGRWIVATCRTYLLVIDTLIGNGRYAGSLGFDRSFPAESKPVPKRLQLKPEHVAFMGAAVNFTPAKFNTGPDQTENTIVTSSGPFVIAWDFTRMKAGRADKYDIRRYDDTVVADNFRFGNDKDIIVALSNDVLMVDKKKLQKPSRKSIAPSRNSIVNSPY
ncbi:hypothetical protein BOTBODRAFT_26693 [Botryobasidium botryosum FD-172 SS1]|uniref:Vacuolar import/degradation Vid27 C-terminal domain-containing protein n=1 Tax=Botryobasidium botryosum (strain FD-172 SS1) TaxID=930990 RepID=A0A067N969_BOTB1|nr:hypothetical protein BOTBODRAFT_26693 [Botryobasidium botryosum FD-172 SS1]